MASGTNATNYKNIKELIKPVKCFQRKEDVREGSHNSSFIGNTLSNVCIKLTLLNHSAKVKWDVSLLDYFHIS